MVSRTQNLIKKPCIFEKNSAYISQHTCRASAEKQAKFGGFLLLWELDA